MRRTPPALERLWTVMDIVRWATDYFSEKSVDSPRLTIELMLCAVLDVTRIRLYTDYERPLLKTELADLRHMIQRRVLNEPLQYILGKADFYGLSFNVSPDVLIPRPETEILVERCIRLLKARNANAEGSFGKGQEGARCLDIGTGSGCIAITVAKYVIDSQWTAIDISSKAAAIARENALRLSVADRVTVLEADIKSYTPDERFDMLVMNPPYIPAAEVPVLDANVRDYEPHAALTDDADGLTFYKLIAEKADALIKEDAWILVEIGYGQHGDVQQIFHAAGFSIDILNDLENIPRVGIVRRHAITIT